MSRHATTCRRLPHWKKDGAIYWITFRLADAIRDKRRTFQDARKRWLKRHPEPWTDVEWKEYNRRFDEKIESWLDAGMGSRALARVDAREAVKNCLLRFDGERHRLHAAVIMPTHVHLLMEPLGVHDLSRILQGIKGASALKSTNSWASPGLSGLTNPMITLCAAKSSIGASSATSWKTPQEPDCATTSIGAIKAAQASLLSALRQKDNEKGRQECLPHLHTRFLKGSTSHCTGVALIDSRIKQLTVTIHAINQVSRIGKLSSKKGGPLEARKHEGVDQDLTKEERHFLRQAVEKMIRRVAEKAHAPEKDLMTISLSELPPCK